jgi:hypothetical protein
MHKLIYPLSVLLLAGSLFAASPFDGNWKVNVAKSKFGGPDKPPKEVNVTIQEQGDRLEVTVRGTSADGSPISYKYSVPQTGGAFQYSEGAPKDGSSDVLAKRKADSGTFDFTVSRDGKVTLHSQVVVSSDGKSMRQFTKGTDPQGKTYETVEVYDKT